LKSSNPSLRRIFFPEYRLKLSLTFTFIASIVGITSITTAIPVRSPVRHPD
jgi:hypothetical protein